MDAGEMTDVARVGSVAGLVLCAEGATAHDVDAAKRLLERFFVEVHVAGGSEGASRGVVAGLAEGLAHVAADRVVVVDAAARVDPVLLLALTAWPEDDLVRGDGTDTGCVVVRREPALAAARGLASAGADGTSLDWSALEAELSVSRLPEAECAALRG